MIVSNVFQFRAVMIHSLVPVHTHIESQKYHTACGTFKKIISWLLCHLLSSSLSSQIIGGCLSFIKTDDTKLSLACICNDDVLTKLSNNHRIRIVPNCYSGYTSYPTHREVSLLKRVTEQVLLYLQYLNYSQCWGQKVIQNIPFVSMK